MADSPKTIPHLAIGTVVLVKAIIRRTVCQGNTLDEPPRRRLTRAPLSLPRAAWVVGHTFKSEGILREGNDGDAYGPPENFYTYLDDEQRHRVFRIRFWDWQKEEVAFPDDVSFSPDLPEPPQAYAMRVWKAQEKTRVK